MNTKTTSIKEAYTDLPAWVKLLLILAFIIVVVLVTKYILNSIKKAKQQKIIENSQVTTTVNGQAVSVDLGTRASAIHAAFHDNDWFGMSENEEQAMTELMNVPKNLVPKLSEVYYNLYGKNLKSEFQSYLSVEQWNKISGMFSSVTVAGRAPLENGRTIGLSALQKQTVYY
jgi:hypothetical protein